MNALAASTRTVVVPEALEWKERLRDGSVVRIRSIRSGDAGREHAFLKRLSPEDRAYRFIALIRAPDERVARYLTCTNPVLEVALVALARGGDRETEIGAAQYSASKDGSRCDCAVAVDPQWQRRGVGRLLMWHLIDIARARGIRRMYAVDPVRCAGAHHLAECLGFHCRPDPEDPVVTTFELTLR
ncbi:MAG TPA: GNAT family N-acetyltransferase [Rudaea sp.]|nr:GNAT family N-acetyltransferase [Rudaea sp.]